MKIRLLLNRVFSFPFLIMIWIYQRVVSPFLPSSCIYWPSCSNYAKQAFQKHGLFWGIYLTFNRLIRCHPFCQGGVDRVPEKPSFFKIDNHG